MKMFKVAIIDDYISREFLNKYDNLEVIDLVKNRRNKPLLTHGTICTDILLDGTENMDITAICIKEINENGDIDLLLQALDYCINRNIKIINMSMGSVSMNDKVAMYPYIKEITKNKRILVAAHSNISNENAYPASFDGVIGVKNINNNCYKPFVFKLEGNKIQIGFNGKRKIRIGNVGYRYTLPSNSFAAASFTNFIIKNMGHGTFNVDDVKKLIRTSSLN